MPPICCSSRRMAAPLACQARSDIEDWTLGRRSHRGYGDHKRRADGCTRRPDRSSPDRGPLRGARHQSVRVSPAGWQSIARLRARRACRRASAERPFPLHYACRSRPDAAFLHELQGVAGASFHFDDENEGRFLDVAGIVAAAPKDAHLYCCGPTPMLHAFEAAAKDWPRAQIHVEYFTPKQEAAKAKKGGFTVELARSGQEFFIPEGRSILEVLLDEGVDVDYSCELGICGACEQRIISGIAEHHDSILSEEEQAENKRVMICCAGSKSERLVLDM